MPIPYTGCDILYSPSTANSKRSQEKYKISKTVRMNNYNIKNLKKNQYQRNYSACSYPQPQYVTNTPGEGGHAQIFLSEDVIILVHYKRVFNLIPKTAKRYNTMYTYVLIFELLFEFIFYSLIPMFICL